MQRFATIGINHKFAPLEIRECLAFPEGALPLALRNLRGRYGINEAVILSTCNRVELITFSESPTVRDRLCDFLSEHHHVSRDFFEQFIYLHKGINAIEHTFRVASSLDSLVLGETQVLNQLKNAYRVASAERATGKALNSLMHAAFSAAKRVHTETSISRGQLSIASVAVSFVRRLFEDLGSKTAIIIGAGETGKLVLQHLRDAGIGRVIIANRSLESAQELAATVGKDADAVPLDLLDDYLPRADIVVSQTAAAGTVLDRQTVMKALKARRFQPMFLVDLAVPRDIQAEAGNLEGVYLYDIDDLQKVVSDAAEQRAAEVERCRAVIKSAVDEFVLGFRTIAVGPLIAEMRKHAAGLVEGEFDRVSHRLPDLNQSQLSEIKQFADRLVNKLLHGPINAMKDEIKRADSDTKLVSFAARMFDLDAPNCPDAPATSEPRDDPERSNTVPSDADAGGDAADSEKNS